MSEETHKTETHKTYATRLQLRPTTGGVLALAMFLNYPILWGAYFWVKAHPGSLPVPDIIGLGAHDVYERYNNTPMAASCIWPVPLLNLQAMLYVFWLGLMGWAGWLRRDDTDTDIPIPTPVMLALVPVLIWAVARMFYLPDWGNYLMFPACRGPLYLVIGPATLFAQLALSWGAAALLREGWGRIRMMGK